jgi:hypothetical protein
MPDKLDIPRRDGSRSLRNARAELGGTFCEERLERDDDRWRRRERDLTRFMDRWRRRQASDYDPSSLD